MKTKNCGWCKTSFESETANFCSMLCRNRSIALKNDYESISKKLRKNFPPSICKECGASYEYVNSQKFCSRTCVAKHNNRNRDKEVYKKQSETLKRNLANGTVKLFKVGGYIRPPKQLFKLNCFFCKKEFDATSSKKKQKYCSVTCRRAIFGPLDYKQSLMTYRKACAFKFNLADYSEEFDFELIKKHGWYSPKNKKNNLGGVSRDHIISVKFGHENNIDPGIISHPANCQLLVHNENVSKYSDCYMTVNELKQKILKWNKKYSKD